MIQLTEEELQELMINLYNRKDSFNTLLEVREYINNEISKVKNLALSGVVESVLCVDSKMHNFITVGKKYEILQKDELSCIIVNDIGIQQVYKMNCFKKL